MQPIQITREMFLETPQGRTFSDVVDDSEQPFDEVLAFFSDADRQQRMEDAEIHHDRPALAGVVRELEAQPAIDRFWGNNHSHRSKRLRQAIGVVVRIIMEQRGWRKTGRKGSLGVRASRTDTTAPHHNSGGLSFWFIRAERYEREEGMPFRTVKERCRERDIEKSLESPSPRSGKSGVRRSHRNGTARATNSRRRARE